MAWMMGPGMLRQRKAEEATCTNGESIGGPSDKSMIVFWIWIDRARLEEW
jgi:hypothetical protein